MVQSINEILHFKFSKDSNNFLLKTMETTGSNETINILFFGVIKLIDDESQDDFRNLEDSKQG